MPMRTCRLMTVLGVSLLEAACHFGGPSTQEDLGRGIVRGTLGARPASGERLAIPANAFSVKGQVTAVEGGAYVLQDAHGVERRLGHDENTRIDRPAHVGDRIEVFMDDRDRAVFIQNIDRDERLP
jgi:hypothetical protein